MPKSDPIKQLSILNELLANAGISAPDIAEHVRRVLDFLKKEYTENKDKLLLHECVSRLAHLHFNSGEPGKAAFAHWHVPTVEHFSSLWIRRSIIIKMKQLVGFRSGFLLVTGLREAICTEGAYWTKKRQVQYDRIRAWIDDLSYEWTGDDSKLQVVVF